MDGAVLLLLGAALVILALAIWLPKVFRKSIRDDRRQFDRNGDRRDGRATATWMGIRKSADDDSFTD